MTKYQVSNCTNTKYTTIIVHGILQWQNIHIKYFYISSQNINTKYQLQNSKLLFCNWSMHWFLAANNFECTHIPRCILTSSHCHCCDCCKCSFFCFFLALVLLEEAATALGVVDTLALGVVDAAVALEDATGADAALALAFLAAIALEDAPGIALVASASTLKVVGAIGVNAVVGCTVEPPTLPRFKQYSQPNG